MPTKAEIRNRALRKVRVIGSGGTPSTDEITDTEDAYDQLHAFLETKDAVTWDSDEDIPDEAAYYVAVMLAANIADEHVDEARYQRIQREAYGHPQDPSDTGALGQLVDLANSDYVPTVVTAEYF